MILIIYISFYALIKLLPYIMVLITSNIAN